jgi:hypothetical protein
MYPTTFPLSVRAAVRGRGPGDRGVVEGRRLDDYLLEQFNGFQEEVGFDEGTNGNEDIVFPIHSGRTAAIIYNILTINRSGAGQVRWSEPYLIDQSTTTGPSHAQSRIDCGTWQEEAGPGVWPP